MAEQDYTIIAFPEFAALQAEVEKLRTELSMLLLERDELLYVECKNIEMMYTLAVGELEYKAYELTCAVLRCKRKLELVQAKKNRQEFVDLPAIEQLLELEFAAYQEKLNEQINKMNDALERSREGCLSEEEVKELKKLYRMVVKALHPDLHPENSDAKNTLFRNAVTAYKNGDLNSLRIISAMVAEPTMPEQGADGMTVLKREKLRLLDLLHLLREQMNKVKTQYPYTMKPIVQDKEKLAARRAEFEETIAQLKDVLEYDQGKLERLMR